MATVLQVLDAIFKRRLANPGRALLTAAVETGSWTAVIRGSGTAGTYETASQACRYTRIGRRVFYDVGIVMAAAVTGGGTGYIQITGAPYAKSTNSYPIGSVFTSGIDFTAASPSLSLQFTSGASSILFVHENVDNQGGNDAPISGLGANDQLYGSISFETDDA